MNRPSRLAAKRNEPTSRVIGHHESNRARLTGDLIGPGYASNYGSWNQAKFVYLTATLDAATWGAELALGEGPGNRGLSAA
jgi:rifampin ADP-ribosylating transferase